MAASFEDLLQRAVEVTRFEAFAERTSRPAHPSSPHVSGRRSAPRSITA
ncbi:hypothetical protein [Streptomyces sp. WELS2]|nr:hypothetical protein [Streptomyces sp. WELS2]